jgi:hypothetical protein
LPTDLLNLVLASIALVVATPAAWFTYQSFRLKSGQRVRGWFGVTSTVDCDDKFVGHVLLENLKDRAVVIFKIFLELSHGYWVQVEDFGSTPLILRPFEVFERDYGPIEYYTFSLSRVDINALIDNSTIRRRLVLSTTDGKHVVREWIRGWNPIGDFFKNHTTAVITPIRSTLKGVTYGANIKYLVHLTMPDGTEETIGVRKRGYNIRLFKRFDIPQQALSSAESLEEFLLSKAIDGSLRCADLTVRDLDAWRDEVYEHRKETADVVAKPRGWVVYHVLGRFVTWWSDVRMRRSNRRTQKLHLAALKATRRAEKEPSTPPSPSP